MGSKRQEVKAASLGRPKPGSWQSPICYVLLVNTPVSDSGTGLYPPLDDRSIYRVTTVLHLLQDGTWGRGYALSVKNLLSIHGVLAREMGPGRGRGETGREGGRQTETQAKALKPQLCPRNDFSAVENSHSISAEPEQVHDPH